MAATVALLVFIFNAVSAGGNRRIENLSRFNQSHRFLFDDRGYIARNITAIETGTLKRDPGDPRMRPNFT